MTVKPLRINHSAARHSPVLPVSICCAIVLVFCLTCCTHNNMKKAHKVFKLRGKVQNYAWGGSTYIPQLLGIENPDQRPFAEYWMGAHDNGAAGLEAGEGPAIPLNEYIRQHPETSLGPYTTGRFGRMP